MVYKGILRQRTLQRKILVLVSCGILLYLEFARNQMFYFPFTFLLILAVFFQKEHIVSENGVDIKYFLLGMTYTNRWAWDEIDAMQPDFIKERPNARLSIGKGSTIRSFLFTPEDCRGVMDLAAEMNPNIFIDDFTAEEQEEMEKEKLRRQEQLRQQKAKARKKKRKNK